MAKLNTTKSWEMDGSQQQQQQQQGRQRDVWDYGNGGGSVSQGSNRPPPGMGLPQKPNNQGNSMPVSSTGGNYIGQQNNSFNAYRNSNQTGSASWGANPSGGHFWLLLRNLTPQIDGSTLKTLCLQHGPLTKFHLYLNHGIALVKYSNRDEAPKAQNALNNCVLGNTTILAETASETDVFNLMQGLNGGASVNSAQSSSNNAGFTSGNPNKTGGENPWGVAMRDNSPLWNNSPWGSSSMDAPDRSTPSSLNNLLPGDLLGGESA